MRGWRVVVLGVVWLAGGVGWAGEAAVGPVPEGFFAKVADEDREVARGFYRKHVDAGGLAIVAAEVVDDRALVRGHEIVTRMLAGRPDIVRAMGENGMYVVIIGKEQKYTDMPEYRNRRNPDYLNERVRGTGGKPTSFGEENILSLPIDRYDDESIAVHEFAHTIDQTLRSSDPEWFGRLRRTYAAALDAGLFRDTYAGSVVTEYWAELVQAYFDCNRVNNWNHGPIGTREQLKVYDPAGYELVREVFKLTPEQDWRYRPLQVLPNVIAPPPAFKIDAFYTRFSYARELPVVGRGASDESLLKVNHLVRRMFTYRHDILKVFIAAGGRVVVLGTGERLADLPEHADWQRMAGYDPLARMMDYTETTRTFVVAEDQVADGAPRVADHPVVAVLGRAIYDVCGQRPVAPVDPRVIQQYEKNVERIDVTFGAKVDALFKQAREAGKWRGTAAIHSPANYWTKGVLAYFDAAGQDFAPADGDRPIRTRAELRAYDPALWELVDQTMGFRDRRPD
jgi:hypothetical protein